MEVQFKLYYTVYKVTNKLNGYIYIGAHRTKDLNDNYLGSGNEIVKAVKEYGAKNFTREYLHVFDNPKEMHEMERQLVNEDFLLREDVYNRNLGGIGSWYYANANRLNVYDGLKENFEKVRNLGTLKHLELMNNPEYAESYKLQVSKGVKRYYDNGGKSVWIGRKHTQETKDKIGAITSKAQKGKGNSQYGTCWIYSLTEQRSMKIKKTELDQYLKDGWTKGRKMTF